MSRCFILGAGFSKAVANLPVMRELCNIFMQKLDIEIEQGHKNRVHWGERIRSYFDLLEDEFFRKLCIDTANGEKYEDCNFLENLEAIVTFIDLNLSGEIHATKIDQKGHRSDFEKSCLFWRYTDLEELRSCIQTYIYLALIDADVNESLMTTFVNSLSPSDRIITFNYDLVIDQALYNTGYWRPKDGYGITFKEFPNVNQSNDVESTLRLYKLHGSLNWEQAYCDALGDYVTLEHFFDNGAPIFSDYLDDEKKHSALLAGKGNSQEYVGKHTGLWIMPSFIKQFDLPELLQIWQRAFTSLQNAQEVVVIGYSLPKEDSAACLLFGTTCLSTKNVVLVDPKAEELKDKYRKITGNKNPNVFYSLNEYLEQ